jgi:hypothetical protein
MKGIEQFVQVDAATLGALKYAGTWNASTNTPTLASGVGVQGQYYVVSVAGSTNLDGVTNWGVGDWAVFNGTVWQRVEGGADGNFVNLSVTGTATVSGTAEFADGLAASPSITNIGDTNTGMYFPSADAIGIVTGGVNRIRVTSAGDVGIGTTTPAVKLDVANGFVVVGANSANPGVGGNIRFRDDTGASRWLNGLLGGAAATSYSIYDIVAGAERLSINSSGDVGIGTSSPVGRLTIQGAAGTNGINQGIGLLYSNGTQYGAFGLNNTTGWPQLMARAGAGLTFHVNSDLLTTGEAMRIDASGNLGLGVTPAAHSPSGFGGPMLQVGNRASILGSSVYSTLGNNVYYDSGFFRYIATDEASMLEQANGAFAFYTAPSGTAGNAISFTQTVTLDSSGNLGIGTSSPLQQLHLSSASATGMQITYQGVGAARIGVAAGNLLTFGLDTSNGTTTRMTLDASGNLGIGTSSPVAKLDVRGASGGILGQFLENDSGNSRRIRFSISGDVSNIESTASVGATNLAFAVDGSERARIDGSGDLIVGGTTTNSIRLTAEKSNPSRGIIAHVSNTGSSGLTGSQLMFTQNTVNNWAVGQPAGVDAFAIWSGRNTAADGTEHMRIDASGNLGVGTSSPTYKADIQVASGADRNILLAGVSGASNGFHVKWVNSTSKTHVIIADIPTSSAGLAAGTLWNDGGTIKIA